MAEVGLIRFFCMGVVVMGQGEAGKESVAVIVDGEYLRRVMAICIKDQPNAEQMVGFAKSCVQSHRESLFRIFFYDCFPFAGKWKNPISKKNLYGDSTEFYAKRTAQLKEIAGSDFVAFRAGEVKARGHSFSRRVLNEMVKKKSVEEVTDDDVMPQYVQKRVDIKMGLDIAWLSNKHIVDRIALISGDGDLVPAMKHARREGVQVVAVQIADHDGKPCRHYKLLVDLVEHADETRYVEVSQK